MNTYEIILSTYDSGDTKKAEEMTLQLNRPAEFLHWLYQRCRHKRTADSYTESQLQDLLLTHFDTLHYDTRIQRL